MAEPKPSPVLSIILAVIVIAAGGGIFAFLYYENHKPVPAGPLTVQMGDNVTVNYIGVLASSPQQGRVFDTSEYSVALNNLSWPKSLQYTSRGGSPSDYTPLPVYVGSGSYTVGNVTYGSVVPGFWLGLIGLPGNQTRYITVSPSQGYPSTLINASCYVTQPLTYTHPVVQTLTPAEFSALFPNVTAYPGTQFPDPNYGWTDQVIGTNASAVVFENLPSLGLITNPSGWPVTVVGLNASTITLQNQLTPSQAGLILGHTAGGTVCASTSFIVTQVNLGAGTYVENYGGGGKGNGEIYGQTLIFIVSVVDIFLA